MLHCLLGSDSDGFVGILGSTLKRLDDPFDVVRSIGEGDRRVGSHVRAGVFQGLGQGVEPLLALIVDPRKRQDRLDSDRFG